MENNQAPQENLAKDFTPVAPQAFGPDGKPLNVNTQDIPALYSHGQIGFRPDEKIPALDLSGNPVNIKPDQINQALEQGYKIDTPEMQTQRYLFDKYGSGFQQARSALEGAARGTTLGLSDIAAVNLGVNPKELSLRKEANPYLSGTSEVLGTIAPLILSGGAAAPVEAGVMGAGEVASQAGVRSGLRAIADLSPVALVSKAGTAVAKGATQVLGKAGISAEASNLAARMIAVGAPKMAGSAVEGALYGLSNAVDESALGNADLNAEHILGNVGAGALLGLGAGTAVSALELSQPLISKAIDKSKQYVGAASKKAVSTMFGVGEKDLEDYVAKGGSDYLKDLPDKTETQLALKDRLDGIFKDAGDAKMDYQQAKMEASDLARGAKDTYNEARTEFMNQADDKLLDVGTRISNAVNDLRTKVIQTSSDITTGLEGKTVPVKDINSALADIEKDYLQYGTAQAEKAANGVKDIRTRLADITDESGNIQATDLKKRIQGIDKMTTYSPNAAEFDPLSMSAFKQARFNMDDVLKDTIPEYREAMKPLAEDSKLLSGLKRYGDEQSAVRSLKNIGSIDRETFDKAALQKLEARTGLNVSGDIEDYINRKKNFETTDAATKKQTFEALVDKLKSPQMKSSVLDAVQNNPEIQGLLEKSNRYQAIQRSLGEFGDISEKNIINKFEQAMREGAPAELARRSLINLDKSVDLMGILRDAGLPAKAKNFEEFLDKMKLQSKFLKGNQNGSANVNLFGVVGAMIADGLHHAPLIGAAMGAVLGKLDDKFGPKIAKYILDKYTTLAAMERMGIDTAKELNNHISKFLGSSSTSEGMRKLIVPTSIQTNDKKKKSMNLSEFKDVQNNLSTVTSNPNGSINQLSDKLRSVSKYAPAIANSMAMKSVNAATYLYDKMPKDPISQYSIKPEFSKFKPSDFELSKFSRIYEAVNKPQTILSSLDKGTISSEQVNVLKSVYPEMYQSIKNNILERMVDLKEDLSYSKKLTLGLLFDAPVSAATDPRFILMLQNNQNQAPPQQASSQGPGPQGSNEIKIDSKAISSRQSGSEQILQRV